MFFEVQAKCGHVGKNYYVLKDFPVKANSAKDAAKVARQYPRVKHHHKDAIRDVKIISKEEFEYLIEQNNRDPYFLCSNIQEQRKYQEILYEEETVEKRMFESSRKTIYYGKEILRNPKKFIRNNYFVERDAV